MRLRSCLGDFRCLKCTLPIKVLLLYSGATDVRSALGLRNKLCSMHGRFTAKEYCADTIGLN